MKLTTCIAAPLAAVQLLMAGCSAGGPTVPAPSSGNSGGSTSTSTGGTTVAAPVISTQPADASVVTATTATFSVTATGTDNTYQWQRNGTDITGAVAATYTTPSVGWADDGAKYTVKVTDSAGSVTSAAATLKLALSAEQAAYESFALAANGGIYQLDWHLDYTGGVASDYFISSDYAMLASSPLTAGPTTATESLPANLSPSLVLPRKVPVRVLVNGRIAVVPSGAAFVVTYVGSDVQIDELTSDTPPVVGYSQMRTDYAVHALSGTMGETPAELAQPMNALMYNPAFLDHSAPWATGSKYLTFKTVNKGDLYQAFDCYTTTYDANVDPCYTGTTLAAQLATGIRSNSDNVTYTSASGTTATIAGVPVFVATSPRPQSAANSLTIEYRIYFELNGNVYTGVLIRDGAAIGGGRDVLDPTATPQVITYFDYQFRLNKLAHDSLAAASLL